MEAWRNSELPSELHKRLDATEKQLALYARDFSTVLAGERHRAEQLRQANQQLQAYALDLKDALAAEQRRTRELERAHRDSLLRLLRASRFKDNETASHLRRIAHLTRLVAKHQGWSDAAAELLAAASPMHDVGKIGVPDSILHKPGPLSPEEWKVMRRHPSFGALLLKGSGSPLLDLAHEIALCHHERWDGSGYPRGLKQEQIPASARIVAVCDCYDALRIERAYKPAYSHARACDVIINGDGRTMPQHFEPTILQAFQRLHPEFEVTHARHLH